jgi:hypothetical protein
VHLIVAPGTLMAQWNHELKVLVCLQSVNILHYTSQTNSEKFWEAEGPVHYSKHGSHNHESIISLDDYTTLSVYHLLIAYLLLTYNRSSFVIPTNSTVPPPKGQTSFLGLFPH